MGILETYTEQMTRIQDDRDTAFAEAGRAFAAAADAYHAAIAGALVAFHAASDALGRQAREAIHGPSNGQETASDISEPELFEPEPPPKPKLKLAAVSSRLPIVQDTENGPTVTFPAEP